MNLLDELDRDAIRHAVEMGLHLLDPVAPDVPSEELHANLKALAEVARVVHLLDQHRAHTGRKKPG